MQEKTLEQRFALWKEKNPNGTKEQFEAQSIAARNKHRIQNDTMRNPDGTILINPTLDDMSNLDENRDIVKTFYF